MITCAGIRGCANGVVQLWAVCVVVLWLRRWVCGSGVVDFVLRHCAGCWFWFDGDAGGLVMIASLSISSSSESDSCLEISSGRWCSQ